MSSVWVKKLSILPHHMFKRALSRSREPLRRRPRMSTFKLTKLTQVFTRVSWLETSLSDKLLTWLNHRQMLSMAYQHKILCWHQVQLSPTTVPHYPSLLHNKALLLTMANWKPLRLYLVYKVCRVKITSLLSSQTVRPPLPTMLPNVWRRPCSNRTRAVIQRLPRNSLLVLLKSWRPPCHQRMKFWKRVTMLSTFRRMSFKRRLKFWSKNWLQKLTSWLSS